MAVVGAVDFGATSVRVCRVDLSARPLLADVVHRAPHAPVRDTHGHLRWDWDRLTAVMVDGLEQCLARGPLDSIGIDTWGVDYGLLDDRGRLVAPPFSYRDHRTDDYRDVLDVVGAPRMYSINGLQVQPFNTIFQLAAHDRAELACAAHLVFLPELLAHHLTGAVTAEATIAGTSGLVDIGTGDWSKDLCDAIDLDVALLSPIESPGYRVGEWCGVPVHLVGGHDTASAVAAMGPVAAGGSAFVSTGTWLLVGREQAEPDLSERARTLNFTNETGVDGSIRFLKNITGFWLLEQCRHAWGDPEVPALVAAAEQIERPVPVIDVNHPDFLAPDDMLATITAHAALPADTEPAVITRCIVDSIASTAADVLDQLSQFDDVVAFGGATRLALFLRRLRELSGRVVRVGPVEAAALGNALVQGIALGEFADLATAREAVTR